MEEHEIVEKNGQSNFKQFSCFNIDNGVSGMSGVNSIKQANNNQNLLLNAHYR